MFVDEYEVKFKMGNGIINFEEKENEEGRSFTISFSSYYFKVHCSWYYPIKAIFNRL